MTTTKKNQITVETTVKVPVEKAWKVFTTPEDIIRWNNASDEWHTPKAENDFRIGGKFVYRMEAKDGSVGFDFWGVYDDITTNERIAYTLGDDRKVEILFTADGNETKLVETFEAENTFPLEVQRGGWQEILNNFKKHAESN